MTYNIAVAAVMIGEFMIEFVLQGLFLGLMTQCVLVLSARRISKSYWPEVYLTILFLVSAVLSGAAFFHYLILVIPVIFLLALLAGFEMVNVFTKKIAPKNRPSTNSVFQIIRHTKAQTLICFLLVALILCIDGLYAVFPFYRPDQWNYHLIVAKQISQYSTLRQVPLYYDHIFFTGAYEYFFLIFRFFSDHDIVNQSAVNFFNWSVFFILIPPVVKRLFQSLAIKSDRLLDYTVLVFVLFSTPSRVMISNAKIEPVLLIVSFVLLTHLIKISDQKIKLVSLFVGFLYFAPLSTKLTWIHFMVAFGAMLFIRVFLARKLNISRTWFFAGAALGSLLSLPCLIKNYFFFGNIFHPIQTGFFQSDYWSDDFSRYWQQVSGKAQTVRDYVSELILIPGSLLYETRYYICFLFIGLVGCRLIKSKTYSNDSSRFLLNAVIVLLTGLLVWPLFFRHDIYPRFYYAFVGVIAVISVVGLAPVLSGRKSAFLLLLPAIVGGQLEVKLKNIILAASSGVSDFYVAMGRTGRYQSDYDEINQHQIRVKKAEAETADAVVLADDIQGYFLQGLIIRWDSPDFFETVNRWQDQQKGSSECLWDFLGDMKVRYLHAFNQPFANWPDVWAPVIAQSEIIGSTGRIRFLSDSTLAQQRISCRKSGNHTSVREQMLSSYTLKFSSGYKDGQFSKVIR